MAVEVPMVEFLHWAFSVLTPPITLTATPSSPTTAGAHCSTSSPPWNSHTEDLGDVLNIDRVLWAMAVNTVVSNLDTYNGYYVHNYYLYQDEEGRFQMIPWGLRQFFCWSHFGMELLESE